MTLRHKVARAVVVVVLVSGTVITASCIPPRPPPAVATPGSTPISERTPIPTATVEATGVVVDATLLDLLPDTVGGVMLSPDPETAGSIAAETSIAPFVEAIAVATAFGPVASGTIGDHVVVTVARLRSDTFGDTFFRGWRDTFDEAVCAQAGGIDGHAEAEIAGHRTFIGTCSGGVRTYHVHLPARNVIVSMQALGERRFGERVVTGLTE